MEACAWVLQRSGRLPGRDAWAAEGGETPVGRGTGDVAGFRAGQNSPDFQATPENKFSIKYLPSCAHSGAGGLDQHAAI